MGNLIPVEYRCNIVYRNTGQDTLTRFYDVWFGFIKKYKFMCGLNCGNVICFLITNISCELVYIMTVFQKAYQGHLIECIVKFDMINRLKNSYQNIFSVMNTNRKIGTKTNSNK